MSTKKCPPGGCGLVKDVSEFGKDRTRKDGYKVLCRQCQNASIRAIRQRIKDGEHTARTRAEKHAEGQARFDAHLAELGWVRVGVYINTQTHVAVRCNNGHITKRRPDNIYGGMGCRVCADAKLPGIINETNIARSLFMGDPYAPGGALTTTDFYLIVFTDDDGKIFFKVGISGGKDSERLKAHNRAGRKTVRVWRTFKLNARLMEVAALAFFDEFQIAPNFADEYTRKCVGPNETLTIDPLDWIERHLRNHLILLDGNDVPVRELDYDTDCVGHWELLFEHLQENDEVEKQQTNAQHS